MHKEGFGIVHGLIIAGIIVVVVSIIAISYYSEQKTITAQSIAELERQLEEQGELTEEQERQLEELAEVTCKDVQVPYEAQEPYTEQEPYTDEVCENVELVYKKEEGSCRQYVDNFFSEDEPAKYDCTISNLDDKAGTFSMRMGFNVGEQWITETQNKYIYPQSSKTFYAEMMAEIDGCYCVMESVPTKQECETVTKYKPVTKYRTITKYKTETICD